MATLKTLNQTFLECRWPIHHHWVEVEDDGRRLRAWPESRVCGRVKMECANCTAEKYTADSKLTGERLVAAAYVHPTDYSLAGNEYSFSDIKKEFWRRRKNNGK